MRLCIALFPILFLVNATAYAQLTTAPTPTPPPNSRQGNVNPITGDNAKYDRLRSVEMMIPKDRADDHPLLDPKKGIYRRPGKEETAILAVAEPLLAKYAAFLKMPDTGMVKLNADSSCISDADVVTASERCVPYKLPGSGAAFSFRTESYRLPRLADVILFDGVFKTGGALQQVVMGEIGDRPIEDVTLNTPGLKFLVDLQPVRDSREFMQLDEKLAKGIESDGFLYRRGQIVKVDTTYVLRAIAYRGRYQRTVDGVEYDEMDFDKRRDAIVALRVVDKDAAGNITIAWKKLKDAESPKLKIIK